ncbi:hypothetical protein GALMADRAFT_255165 [Galerina marginata CBS 339.88]|uniref:Nephrocystin 3-like N-terminal domain-containing protein n=1 Tax=Galerina marginata (strain CBS 339.88) TaxID=685588 RepID=A0A067SU20_GALM3|nr:hypothetical protein GALMADRAFT_255165 [Galerina marginata CBS 339.88]
MFSRSHNLQINGGVFTEYNGAPKRVGIELLLDAASPSAFHNSGERFDPPKCYPNTRSAILTMITDWIVGKIGWEQYIMWLYGPAGAGKSAIAQTIAELCRANGILLSSFFFSRSDPGRNNVRPLAASLAYQVAINLPEARSLIESVVESDPAIFQQSFQAQFRALVVEPLMHINKLGIFSRSTPYLIMIDGLDECVDANVQRHILETAAALSSYKNPVHLLFMISSRTEQQISFSFSTSAFEGVTTRIALDDTYQSRADIREYLERCFFEMKKAHLQKGLIPTTWPKANDISLLVEKSSGQFIYAATVVRYISSSRYTPMSSLETILGLRPTRNGAPFAELDALYTDVLSRVEDISATLRLLGAVIHLERDPSPWFLKMFLSLDEGDVTRLLVDVFSLVAFKWHRIQFLHASFSDFLSDPDRSKEYYINPATTWTEFALVGLGHLERYSVDLRHSLGFINRLGDTLLHANPTDELRERLLHTPFLEILFLCLEADSTELEFDTVDFKIALNNLFLVLKTSSLRFSNAEELYLHYRGAWDEILRKQLAQIEFDTVMAAIVASIHTDLHIKTLCNILEAKFGVKKGILLGEQVSDIGISLRTTIFYNCYFEEYRNLMLGFLGDPLRAGKYLFDGEKVAVLSLILLETLTGPQLLQTLNTKEVFKTFYMLPDVIPQSGPTEDLIALINIPVIRFPHDVLDPWEDYNYNKKMCKKLVQAFGKYLDRFCGLVPIGFRITIAGNDKHDQVSYYYDTNDE